MTEAIKEAKLHIRRGMVMYLQDVRKHFNVDMLQGLNVGVMTLEEFVDEMVIELIRYAYDIKAEKKSLRSRLTPGDDSQKEAYARIRRYAQKYRDREADLREEWYGIRPEGLEAMPMDTIKEKIEGYAYNDMQFFELTQLQEIRIFKSFVEHRLEDTNKVKNEVFKELFEEYEDFVDTLKIKEDMTNEEIVFYSLAYWVIQWKYNFEFFYAIAAYIEENPDIKMDKTQIVAMCGEICVYRPYGSASGPSRFIKTRNKMISKLLYSTEEMSDDVAFDTDTLQDYLHMRVVMLECLKLPNGQSLRDWFVDNTSMEDWAEFLKEYDVFSIHQIKEWSKKKIRYVRKLIQMLTVK